MGGRTSWFFMRTERATITAFSGGRISEESFAISTAILAAPYAALQADSSDDPGSSGTGSVGSEDWGRIDKGIELDEATSALRSFFWGWNVASSCFMYSAIGKLGVPGGLFVGVDEDDDGNLFRKLLMVDARTRPCVCPQKRRPLSECMPWSKNLDHLLLTHRAQGS
jgi:hypothetical protein